jgi:GNAT superfamily N-acetyltransferase
MRPSDSAAWADLLAAIREVDKTWEYFTAEELLEEFADPDWDFEHGSIAILNGDRMVGTGAIWTRSQADPVHDVRYEGGVHPEFRGRGIGAELLRWAEEAAVPLHVERFPGRPLSLSSRCSSTNAAAVELHELRGFRMARWFNGMIRDLSVPPPEVADPPGVEIVAWAPQYSAAARIIRNETFHDHWGSTETTQEGWDYFMSVTAFRPQFSFLAFSGGEAVGLVIAHEYEAYPGDVGRDLYIPLVGTQRTHRKRGVASALLTRALDAAASDGFARASLDVDADSPTGALGVYEELGFRVMQTAITMTKELS